MQRRLRHRRKHGIYESIFETPRPPQQEACKSASSDPQDTGKEYVDDEQDGSSTCPDHYPPTLQNPPTLLGRLRSVLGGMWIVISMEIQREIQKNMTVYNFDTIDVDGKPEVQFKCLKRLVGERGFEPPTPWSRTRFMVC